MNCCATEAVPNFRAVRRRSPIPWVLFGLAGRVSRSVYWLATLFLIALDSAVLSQVIGAEAASYNRIATSVWPVLVAVTIYCNLAIGVKRLHDLAYSGFLALALFIPVVNVAFSIWVGILPGTAGPNRYGAVPDVPPP